MLGVITVVLFIVLMVVIVSGLVVALFGSGKGMKKTSEVRAELAQYLEGVVTSDGARGTRHGVATTIRYVSHGEGSDRKWSTQVDGELGDYPLALVVRHHRFFDAGKIAKGRLVDVQLGDPAFDRAFLVDASPEAVIVQLLDAPARQLLLRLGEMREPALTIATASGRTVLRLELAQWLEHVETAKAALDGVARIASRVPDAFGKMLAADAAEGAPFRGR